MLQSLGSALTSDKWTAAAVSQESQALDGESTWTKKKKKKKHGFVLNPYGAHLI